MPHFSQKRLALLGGLLSLVILATAGLLAYRSHQDAKANLLSDDATINAEVLQVATSVPGRIKALHVRENQFVHAGDLLVELDDTAYRLAVAQTQADLELAASLESDQARNIRAEEANAAIAAEQVERAQVNLEFATQSLERLLPMEAKGYVSKQQIDDARTLQRDAQVSLNEAMRQLDAAEALIGDEEGTAALVRAREAAVAIAEHELAGTKIYAPFDGRIVGVTAQQGSYVMPAQSLFGLIDTAEWYISANYTETVLPGIRVGNCVTGYSLSDRRQALKGVVTGIGWGVGHKDLIQLPSALPIVPKSLEWVRVQQRFPVRIELIDPPEDLMRVGASAVTIVHHATDC